MNDIKEKVFQMFIQNLEQENKVRQTTIERLKDMISAGKLSDLHELNSLIQIMENNHAKDK